LRDVNDLVDAVFSGLTPLVFKDLTDEGERILVRTRTPADTGCRRGKRRPRQWLLLRLQDIATRHPFGRVSLVVMLPVVCTGWMVTLDRPDRLSAVQEADHRA